MRETAEDLKRVPLFADLNRHQLKKLARNCQERTLPAGATPVREGTMSGIGFFVIADGEAAVSIRGEVVATLKAGDHFGEHALVSKTARTATVTATTELRLLEIAFYDFREFALANPDVSWKLLQHVVGRLEPSGSLAPV
jgi:CRP-like cAMP-binding protein